MQEYTDVIVSKLDCGGSLRQNSGIVAWSPLRPFNYLILLITKEYKPKQLQFLEKLCIVFNTLHVLALKLCIKI